MIVVVSARRRRGRPRPRRRLRGPDEGAVGVAPGDRRADELTRSGAPHLPAADLLEDPLAAVNQKRVALRLRFLVLPRHPRTPDPYGYTVRKREEKRMSGPRNRERVLGLASKVSGRDVGMRPLRSLLERYRKEREGDARSGPGSLYNRERNSGSEGWKRWIARHAGSGSSRA